MDMTFVNAFFQQPQTIIKRFGELAIGQRFEYVGVEYIRVEGGYKRTGPGRPWSKPRTLPKDTPVRL